MRIIGKKLSNLILWPKIVFFQNLRNFCLRQSKGASVEIMWKAAGVGQRARAHAKPTRDETRLHMYFPGNIFISHAQNKKKSNKPHFEAQNRVFSKSQKFLFHAV